MSQDDRERMGAGAALVDEMNPDAVHRGPKLREPVDRLLLPAPVERRRPVLDEPAQLALCRPQCPAVLDLVRPARPPQAILQVVECVLRYVHAERVDASHGSNAMPVACPDPDRISTYPSTRPVKLPRG